MNRCPQCPWPLADHDRDINFRLPDELADWTAQELTEKTSRLDTFLHVKPDRFFMRALVPIHLTEHHTLMFGVWLAVDRPTMEAAARIWNTPAYGSFSCSGLLANALPPWPEAAGLPVRAETRQIDELPYVITSSDPKMNEILDGTWPHELVLSTLAASM